MGEGRYNEPIAHNMARGRVGGWRFGRMMGFVIRRRHQAFLDWRSHRHRQLRPLVVHVTDRLADRPDFKRVVGTRPQQRQQLLFGRWLFAQSSRPIFGLIGDKLSLEGWFWTAISRLNDNLANFGFAFALQALARRRLPTSASRSPAVRHAGAYGWAFVKLQSPLFSCRR
jgi:hypothetical protein